MSRQILLVTGWRQVACAVFLICIQSSVILPIFSASAFEIHSILIFLDEGYTLRVAETGFMVHDISDRHVLDVRSLPAGAKLYFSELEGALLFKVISLGSGNAQASNSHYWFNKTDETTEQLTQKQFKDRLSRLTLREDDIQWRNPEDVVEEKNTVRYKLLNFYYLISLLLGIILPIPFIRLAFRYWRLRKHLRELNVRDKLESPKLETR